MNNMQKNMFVWRAETARDQSIALVDTCLEEFVPEAVLHDIPMSEPCCSQVIIWSGRPLPVVKTFSEKRDTSEDHYVANVMILKVRAVPDTRHIGLLVLGYPQKHEIDDSSFSNFNLNECGSWRHCLISGFVHENRSIPIIDPDLICSRDFIRAQNRKLKASIYESW